MSHIQQHSSNVHDGRQQVKIVDELVSATSNLLSPQPTSIQPTSVRQKKEASLRRLDAAVTKSVLPPGTVTVQQFPTSAQTSGTSLTTTSAPLELNTKSATFPTNIESRPSAADSLILDADVNSSERDVSLFQHQSGSDCRASPPPDVLLDNLSELLYNLKSIFCRYLCLIPSQCGNFSPPKCLLLTLGDSFIMAVSVTSLTRAVPEAHARRFRSCSISRLRRCF